MDKNIAAILLVVLMVVLIIVLDIVLFRHHLLARLLSNVGLVLLFIAFYLRFIRHP